MAFKTQKVYFTFSERLQTLVTCETGEICHNLTLPANLDVYGNRLSLDCMLETQKAEIAKREQAKQNRNAKSEAMKDMGMKRVRGNLGGTYWE